MPTETGHAKNVANFDLLITHLQGFDHYNPTNPDLAITALQSLHVAADAAVRAVGDAKVPYSLAVDDREAVFNGIDRRATRIENAVAAAKGGAAALEDVKTLTRKIKGERATPVDKDADPDHQHSVSQQSYANLEAHMGGIIQLLGALPAYNPNEADLKVSALTALHTDMKAKNKAVNDAFAPLQKARRTRNEALYAEETGLVDIALQVKKYVKSMEEGGSKSAEYAAVAGIKFDRVRRK